MSCLKCGRDTEENQVFCLDCLTDMEKYPVRPGTAVMLPKRREQSQPKKASKRKTLSPEDQVKKLRIRVRILAAALALALLATAVLAVPAWKQVMGARHRKGQNYSVVTTPSESRRAVSSAGGR